jgi:tRNA uridine 5-carboxymethylaminomethyl modification enzyme
VNGTTGYEEAAAQGLLAGLNAARAARDEEGWCPRRDEAYLGVLVDDLVTRGVSEPYRMFTSRAEYRLQLREDNADLRLTEAGRRLGLVDDARWAAFGEKREAIEKNTAALKSAWAHPSRISIQDQIDVVGQPMEREHSLFDLMRRPGVSYEGLSRWMADGHAQPGTDVAEQVEIAAKYAGYIDRQRDEVERQRAQESLALPADIDYSTVRGLSREVQQKLAQHRPQTVGQASRIQGVTPAAISLLLVHLKRRSYGALAKESHA